MAFSIPGRRLIVPNGISIVPLILTFLYGALLGFTPSLVTLHSLLLIVSLCFLRLPLILLALVAAASWALGWVGLDVWIDALGVQLLREPALQSLWTEMYNAPLLPWTRFNNSMVLGAAVISFLLLPLWIFASIGIRRSVRA